MNNNLKIKIAIESLFILYKLQEKKFEAYVVGGAVRDILLDENKNSIKASDYDFTTSAKPEEIQSIFPENFYENKFGTVGISKTHLHEQMELVINQTPKPQINKNQKIIDLSKATKIHQSLKTTNNIKTKLNENEDKNKEIYEITTFRSDGEYKDHRRPEDVTWGKTLKDDLSRRDFTLNAIAIKINNQFLSSLNFKNNQETIEIDSKNFEIIDFHHGLKDLENGIIKTVGNPDTRFNEDALRLLRAIRFSVQLNMKIDNETYEAIIKNASLIKHVSWERIRDEFLKMIASNYPKEAINLLDDIGLLNFILPEITEGKLIMQGGHHTTDVWNHSLDALSTCPSKDPIVRLATLLHDVGKPRTLKIINNKPTFYNHEVIGSRIAKTVAKRLKLSKDKIDKIFILVRYHMFHYQPENSDASVRRFMRKVGLENIDDILDLREADRLGSGAKKTSWRLEEMKQRMIEQLHQPFSISDLKINGNDLISKFSLNPGPTIGNILNTLFEKVVDNPELNTKEKLLEEAKKLIS